jgi:hypothetical protein
MAEHNIGRELLDVPMGEMIKSMAFAIADAQIKLDSNSIKVAQMMGGLAEVTNTVNGEEHVVFEDSRVFFGKDKMQLSTALEVYNTSNDVAQKASIKQNAIDGNTDAVKVFDKLVVVATGGTLTNMTSATTFVPDAPSGGAQNAAVYYKRGASDYYIWDGTAYVVTTPVEKYALKPNAVDKFVYIPARLSMLELGFSPTFYQFVDTLIEVKIAISMKSERSSEVNVKTDSKTNSVGVSWGKGRVNVSHNVTTTQVNATYASKYSYSAEGSSLLRTKLTPIPPPAILEERIRLLMEIAKEGIK